MNVAQKKSLTHAGNRAWKQNYRWWLLPRIPSYEAFHLSLLLYNIRVFRFVRRLNEMQGEEEHLMNQWLEKRDQVDVSLSQMEEQMEQFGEVPLEMKLLEAALEEHEVCF